MRILIKTWAILLIWTVLSALAAYNDVSGAQSQYETPAREESAETWSNRDLSDSITYYNNLIEKAKEESHYFENLLKRERLQLIKDINTMLNIYPLSEYNGEILIRLAELYYEKETEDYDDLLDQREEMISVAEARGDTLTIPVPPLEYTQTLATYERILSFPGYKDVQDDALYYLALCLIRMKQEDLAMENFQALTERFPESNHYTATQIKIGDYFFNRPFLNNGQGYNLAANTYKKAIKDQENPLFHEALYKLGWCYFQQDRYNEAIDAFKTLIEKSHLNFTESSHTQLISNPLLREEAVEFLAVSLDEIGSIDEALKFLRLVGNEDYASKVLLKYGGLYTQRSDFEKANEIFTRLLENYPLSLYAAQAKLDLISNHAAMDNKPAIESHQMDFFDTFGKGSEWYRSQNNSEMLVFVDSQAVKILISTTERMLREASRTHERSLYIKVAKQYNRLLEQYPKRRESYEAEWNLAVIFDKYLKNLSSAYYSYIRVATAYEFTTHRKEALLNALNVAQLVWESGNATATQDTVLSAMALDTALTGAETDIIFTAGKFRDYYPRAKETPEVQTIKAAVYFNRKLYNRAIPIYKDILQIIPRPKNYQEVIKLLALSYMGSQQYRQAEEWYGQLAESAVDPDYIKTGQNGQVEAAYRGAEMLENEGKLLEAAKEYIAVSKKYSQHQLADVSRFDAAEAYEKLNQYIQAAKVYISLSDDFPYSKYADGALFNAASNYEAAQKLETAIETYETLISKFPTSAHIKNALFNISLNYEKLKQFEKVAETNVRYAQMFPEEKDAPDMLFDAGVSYMKGEKYDKALSVFQRFYTKYLGSDRELRARLYTGRCYIAMGKKELARDIFQNTITRTDFLINQGKKISSNSASEAQLELAHLLREDYLAIKLTGQNAVLDQAKKEKTSLMGQAANAYQKVFEYGDQNALKATYYLGCLYENFALAWKSQERPVGLTPSQAAISEKKILNTSIKSLSLANPFFLKNLEFSTANVTVDYEKNLKTILDSSQIKIQLLELTKADWLLQSAYVILNTPIPEKIKANPISNFLYRIKILETTSKDFEKAVDAYRESWKNLLSVGSKNDNIEKIQETYARENYLLGGRYALMADEMLNRNYAGLDSLDIDKKEEIRFQLEDMAFELQDGAIPKLQYSLELSQKDDMHDIWSRHIFETLKRLDNQNFKEKPGISLLVTESGPGWWASPQGFPGWESNLSDTVTANIFGPVTQVSFSDSLYLPGKIPGIMWDPASSESLYLRRLVNIDGKVQNAVLDITAEEDFTLYVNGTKIYTDTRKPQDFKDVKSLNIAKHLKPGANLFAIQASSQSSQKGIMFRLTARIDTSKGTPPPSSLPFATKTEESQEKPFELKFVRRSPEELKTMYNTRAKYLQDLYTLQANAKKSRRSLRSEQNEVNQVKTKLETIKNKIQGIDQKLGAYKQKLDGLKR